MSAVKTWRQRLLDWLRGVAVLIVALSLLQILGRSGEPDPPEDEGAVRNSLRRWDQLGCYELRVDAWNFGAYVSRPDAAPPVPTRVMLLPDSLDEWGRSYSTQRAALISGEPLEEFAEEVELELSRSLRWFVRADTLWLVWSVGSSRVGIALFSAGDSLAGQAASLSADSVQGTAHAAAWRINCATLGRKRTQARRR